MKKVILILLTCGAGAFITVQLYDHNDDPIERSQTAFTGKRLRHRELVHTFLERHDRMGDEYLLTQSLSFSGFGSSREDLVVIEQSLTHIESLVQKAFSRYHEADPLVPAIAAAFPRIRAAILQPDDSFFSRNESMELPSFLICLVPRDQLAGKPAAVYYDHKLRVEVEMHQLEVRALNVATNGAYNRWVETIVARNHASSSPLETVYGITTDDLAELERMLDCENAGGRVMGVALAEAIAAIGFAHIDRYHNGSLSKKIEFYKQVGGPDYP